MGGGHDAKALLLLHTFGWMMVAGCGKIGTNMLLPLRPSLILQRMHTPRTCSRPCHHEQHPLCLFLFPSPFLRSFYPPILTYLDAKRSHRGAAVNQRHHYRISLNGHLPTNHDLLIQLVGPLLALLFFFPLCWKLRPVIVVVLLKWVCAVCECRGFWTVREAEVHYADIAYAPHRHHIYLSSYLPCGI